jgi:hypothetical protein
MTKKQIVILAVIFAILVLGIFLKTLVRFVSEEAGSAARTGVALTDFDPAKIERILIGRGLETAPVELAKKNGIWEVKSLWNAPANPSKVEKFIRQLSSARGELRGTGKDLLKDFGIEDMNSFSIKFMGAGNGALLDLRIGTKKSDVEGSFIRKTGSTDVYFADMDLPEILGIHTDPGTAKPMSNTWADLSLFRLDPEKLTKITIYRMSGNEKNMVLGLVREVDPKDPGQGSWKYLRSEMRLSMDPDKVMKFIATMNSVRAEKVVDPDGKRYGIDKPVWQLAVSEGNKKTILIAGPKDTKKDLYYVKALPRQVVCSMGSTYFDDLNVDDTSFVKDVPKAAESGKSP